MEVIAGRLVLNDRVRPGRIRIEDGVIATIEADDDAAGPWVIPGLVDIHIHGCGGFDSLGGLESLEGMSRFLVNRGVTSFLPTAVSSSVDSLVRFAHSVREWMQRQPPDVAQVIGFNLEGPFISHTRRGAHNPDHLREPSQVPWDQIEVLLEDLRVITIAPELPGSLDLIHRVAGRGVTVSLGHSDATSEQAVAGYRAGARAATHLFNAMSAIDHHAPGLASVALGDDGVYVELIADGHHVDPGLWKVVWRTKPADKLVLVSDSISPAGTSQSRFELGGVPVEIRNDQAVLLGGHLAGSMISLDSAVSNITHAGLALPRAVAAASENAARLVRVNDRGRLATGMRADLALLDDGFRVTRAMVAGRWVN